MNDLSTHDDGLSPAARAALATLRAADDLPPEARARVWARLAAAEAPVLSDMSQGPASRKRYTGVLVGLALAAGVALALVSLGRGAQEVAVAPRGDAAVYGDASAADAKVVHPVVPAPAQVPVAATPEPATPVIAAPPEAPRTVLRERREPERREPPVLGDTSTLAAETALLQRAQSALAADDPAAALARLDEHARDFADGVLAREREALRVTALCAAGRGDEGRAAAAAFVRRHPGSLLAERVQGACAVP